MEKYYQVLKGKQVVKYFFSEFDREWLPNASLILHGAQREYPDGTPLAKASRSSISEPVPDTSAPAWPS